MASDLTSEPKRTDYRTHWVTGMRADRLKEKASERANYHAIRLAWWEKEHDKADEEYRDSIKVREHEITGGKQLAVHADQEKANYLSQCKSKITGHQRDHREFLTWVEFFDSLGTSQMTVTYSDMAYFGLPTIDDDAS